MMLTLNMASGLLTSSTADGLVFWHGQLVLEDSDGSATLVWEADPATGQPLSRCGPWALRLRVGVAGALDCLDLELSGDGRTRCGRLILACRPTAAGRGFLQPGAGVIATTSDITAGRGLTRMGELLGRSGGAARFPCSAIAIADGAGEAAILIGIAAPPDDFPFFATDGRCFEFGFDLNRPLPGPVRYSICFGHSRSPLGLLEAYSDLLAALSRPQSEPPTGWNTWDYYEASVTMPDVVQECVAINASALKGRLRYCVLDHGWESAWGDWRPNRKFPQTLAEVAATIRGMGFEPGIWTAPFELHTHVPYVRRRQELFARGPDGDLALVDAVGRCALLDPTQKELQTWLFDTYYEMRRAGFSLFKIDYIYRTYVDQAIFADGTLGKAAAIRSILRTIREAIGDEAHLLDCGGPFEAALGIADSSRVSVDIHAFWGHIVNGARQAAASFWMNRRLWNIDPDFALIRCAETSQDRFRLAPYRRRPRAAADDFWMAGEEASLAELRAWLTVVALCGGSVFLGDSVARLSPLGIETLQRLFAAPRAPARPLDLFENAPPRVWLAQGTEGAVLGLVNWTDWPLEVAVPAEVGASSAWRDFWTGERVRLGATAELPARGSLLLGEG